MINSNGGFSLIWIYWYHKYIYKKSNNHNNRSQTCPKTLSQRSYSLQKLYQLKKKYHIQAIQSHPNIPASTVQSHLDQIKQRARKSIVNPSTTPTIYTINPEMQAKQIQETLLSQYSQGLKRQQAKQLINQLHSYYLNCKNIFIIYKEEKQNFVMEPIIKMINQSSSLRTIRTNSNQKIGNISQYLNLEDGGSFIQRNQSLLDSLDKMENKIDGLEILDKLTELDGLEIWNAKYLGIPHCFLKIRKYTWAKCLNRPLLHPSQPRTISDLPIIPKISKFRPSIDKLMPFVSFLKLLQKYSIQSSPTIDSIFQYNSMPYIFVQQRIDRGGWQQSYGILCYYVVYGDQANCLNESYVKRWVELNPKTDLARNIIEMNELQKSRTKMMNKASISLGLGFLADDAENDACIW